MLKGKHLHDLIVAVSVLLSVTSCFEPKPVTTGTSDFRAALGFNDKDRWVVLARPTTGWTLGTVVEVKDGKSPEDIGNLLTLPCFPKEVVRIVDGEVPQSAYTNRIDYGFSLSATFGLSSVELAKAGLEIGGADGKPNFRIVMSMKKAREKRLDFVALEGHVLENFDNMSANCRRVIVDADRYFTDKIYQISEGSIVVERQNGAKIDLTAPPYKFLRDATLKAGFEVSQDGSIVVPEEMDPVTFAVRTADFREVLQELGIERRFGPDAMTFEESMLAAGLAVPY